MRHTILACHPALPTSTQHLAREVAQSFAPKSALKRRHRPSLETAGGVALIALMLASVPAAAVPATAAAAPAISDGVVRIGVLTDLAGPYASLGGKGSVIATQMAIDDCLKAECSGMKIEKLVADHQNKADIAASKAREWLDRDHVDAMTDLTNSAAAIAVQDVMRNKGAVGLFNGPATKRLTNEDCAPNGFHWMFDTYSLSAGAASAITRSGGDSWFFLTVDYAFGHDLEKDATKVIGESGGKVLGAVRHPLNASDYSSFILQAQSSKAKIIGLADATADAVNAIKSAREFGVGAPGGAQKLAPLLLQVSDVHALGLPVAQGLTFAEGFYWDMDERTREFAARFEKAFNGKPNQVQAGVYSSVRHYLKAVAAARSDDPAVVSAKMRELPIDDAVMRNASIQPSGRVVHDMYLVEVKTPEESKGPWDYYRIVATIPADKAFQPLSENRCATAKRS